MAQRLELSCPGCRFSRTVVEGTPDRSQVATDLNEDFYEFHLYLCEGCQDLFSLNVFDREVQIRCPRCRRPPSRVELGALHCPRCHSVLRSEAIVL